MGGDIIAVVVFIITLISVCKVFNLWVMKQYKKEQTLKENRSKLTYGCYINNIEKLELAGVGDDGNGDYDISKAIKKIEMPNSVRIRVNE